MQNFGLILAVVFGDPSSWLSGLYKFGFQFIFEKTANLKYFECTYCYQKPMYRQLGTVNNCTVTLEEQLSTSKSYVFRGIR